MSGRADGDDTNRERILSRRRRGVEAYLARLVVLEHCDGLRALPERSTCAVLLADDLQEADSRARSGPRGLARRATTCSCGGPRVPARQLRRAAIGRDGDARVPTTFTAPLRDAITASKGRDGPTNTSFLDELRDLLPVVGHLSTSHCPTMHAG
ncbi:hypothetical protein X777_09107 [Ooceraea biroi]|uniref:Uncharacterized protein n=1 Tax=Ooceraea biroi TaxID=2015173 RepID=A0A026WAS4_OOCBI|nr:hypothetical protein X777_09107 [Ooceraea biroi]